MNSALASSYPARARDDSIPYLGTTFHSDASRSAKQNLNLHKDYMELLLTGSYQHVRQIEKTKDLPTHMLNWSISKTIQLHPELEQILTKEFADRGFRPQQILNITQPKE